MCCKLSTFFSGQSSSGQPSSGQPSSGRTQTSSTARTHTLLLLEITFGQSRKSFCTQKCDPDLPEGRAFKPIASFHPGGNWLSTAVCVRVPVDYKSDRLHWCPWSADRREYVYSFTIGGQYSCLKWWHKFFAHAHHQRCTRPPSASNSVREGKKDAGNINEATFLENFETSGVTT